MTVSVLLHFFMIPRANLLCVIVVFHDHTFTFLSTGVFYKIKQRPSSLLHLFGLATILLDLLKDLAGSTG